ncbi:MAG: MBL fold metallo-hydrolase, partial [Verrucomicrobiota bacterium]|nr:MBL fold metallo-hydrolase [Verrucomicrobiota bacterium]
MIPLEDNFSDIIGKAQRGLRLSDTELAEKARVSSQTLRKLRAGDFDELTLLRVAPVLGLAARALSEFATGGWQPKKTAEVNGLAQFNTRYHDMAVNSYLVWDPKTKDGAAFDTGADCTEMMRLATKENVSIKMILLTHAHSDHIAALAELKRRTGAPVFISNREAIAGADPIDEGKSFRLGKIDIDTRLTWGHSRGGMTYVVNGLARKVAIVGDSLFAGSMGGGSVSYEEALRNNLEKILILPDETIICPGHGPMTTVGEEKVHNPFFA